MTLILDLILILDDAGVFRTLTRILTLTLILDAGRIVFTTSVWHDSDLKRLRALLEEAKVSEPGRQAVVFGGVGCSLA